MKRKTLYSRATRSRGATAFSWVDRSGGAPQASDGADEFDLGPSVLSIAGAAIKRNVARHERLVLMTASVVISLGLIGAYQLSRTKPHVLTQTDINAAVRYTLSNTPRAPADSARAAEIIRPSVVEVESFLSPEHAAALAAEAAKSAPKERKAPHDQSGKDKPSAPPDTAPPTLPDKPLTAGDSDEPQPDAIGSGVVVNENGAVLTALHVITSTDRWVIVFADGSKSDATLIGSQPENDLAVLQAKTVPDELQPAILASTAGLMPGDQVVATGFPFGIGPSVSAGVVSGLRREFDDPKTHQKLTNLIQFDAAVNPGNSGGPLVDRDGEVVGIVIAILNPSEAGSFAGIGFAVPIENAASALGENPL
ncbi:MAG: trypsin-like peptidase domain-containing protein [Steroidobacteraceae bacterium]|jgi:S1-C subfamily serine protease